MKMVVCGKGGSGKSTVTALLAQEWALTGKNVMIVDTDESNIGLHRFLGVNPPTDLMDQMGGKKEVMEKMMSAMKNPDGFDNLKLFDKEWNIADIPSPCVSENQNVKLVSVGKVHHAGEGCACPMGFVAKQFLKNLKLQANEVVIVDTEAGLEHFGRGVEEGVDAVLMVLDPSYESVLLAKKVSDMIKPLNLPMYYVLNKVTPEISRTMRENLPDHKIIGEIPQDPELLTAGLSGNHISDSSPGVKQAIRDIMLKTKNS